MERVHSAATSMEVTVQGYFFSCGNESLAELLQMVIVLQIGTELLVLVLSQYAATESSTIATAPI